jgi:hypothetical protein
MRRARAGLTWLAVVSVLACTSNATVVGPKPRDGYEVLGRTQGSACGLLLFGVIPIGVNSRTDAHTQML